MYNELYNDLYIELYTVQFLPIWKWCQNWLPTDSVSDKLQELLELLFATKSFVLLFIKPGSVYCDMLGL